MCRGKNLSAGAGYFMLVQPTHASPSIVAYSLGHQLLLLAIMQGRPGSTYLVQPLDGWPSAAKKQSVCSPTKPDSDFSSSTIAGYLLVLAERKGRRLCLVRVGSRRLSIAARAPSTYYCLSVTHEVVPGSFSTSVCVTFYCKRKKWTGVRERERPHGKSSAWG
ncbi:hypothetical protein HDV57DRAFT_353670 [Trichoderma longibrachiatum]|uniref:Uncharacterized protein n=1 Tax=Trichoderma longibrachiatum ATCC 18648 TaxID=983965 RepID=A0A2T4BWI2_TRILO|nr:hypothetical protein M440DRAFT_1403870 [Trichoderma longibrachiatum ATCC 18648]